MLASNTEPKKEKEKENEKKVAVLSLFLPFFFFPRVISFTPKFFSI